MAAVDKVRSLATIVVPNTGADGVRYRTQAENNKRTERFLLRVAGQVDITVAGAGLRNRGSILAALTDIGYTDGGADKVFLDARLARFIGECMAPSALPATRLAGVGIQAATQLRETVPLWMASPRSLNPNETKYVETNKQLTQEVFLTPLRNINRLSGGAPTGTITNVQATVEQVYDDLLTVPPNLTVYHRQVAQDVSGANAALKIDLRGSRFIRGLAIQQDTDQGEVSDIINSLVLRGDRESIIGDRSVPFVDMVEHAQEEFGGAVVAAPGYLFVDFQRYGRLSSFWNPYQDTNLRIEADVQPSPGNTGSKIRVAVWEYERTPATSPTFPTPSEKGGAPCLLLSLPDSLPRNQWAGCSVSRQSACVRPQRTKLHGCAIWRKRKRQRVPVTSTRAISFGSGRDCSPTGQSRPVPLSMAGLREAGARGPQRMEAVKPRSTRRSGWKQTLALPHSLRPAWAAAGSGACWCSVVLAWPRSCCSSGKCR
jgi:hypothetical protein